ncbi:MAG: trehalose-phosphatase [Candidatus Omnitrophota bacterium]
MLFLDFDGTLAAIVGHYKNARILQKSKMLLEQIAKSSQCYVAIVSGRALLDVKKRVGLKNVIYAGNHGLEVAGPGLKRTLFVKTDVKKVLRKIKTDLTKSIGRTKGILIEDKTLTLSVHYRRVSREDLTLFKQIFWKNVRPYLKSRAIEVHEGKKVLEIKPMAKWNKGSIVLWLIGRLQKNIRRRKFFPIFIGDDATDETAFAALRDKGLCIRVGRSKASAAQYRLNSIDHVAQFLKIILDSTSRHTLK